MVPDNRARGEFTVLDSHFRLLADTAPVLIWTSGLDSLCDYFNRPWLEFTGRTLEQELGNGWAEGVHPDDFQRCLDIYVSHFQRREPFRMEYRLRRHDGEFRWILDHGVPRYGPGGEFAGFIGSCIDIDEQVRHTQALESAQLQLEDLNAELEQTVEELQQRTEEAQVARKQAQDAAERLRIMARAEAQARTEAERANRAKSQFMSVMSHELRTPLNAIIGYQDLIESGVGGPVTEKQREHLGRIRTGAEQLLGLINQILSLSRIEAGKEDLDLQEADLRELVHEAVALLEPGARKKHIALESTVPGDAVRVRTDPAKVKQILLNLLSNAVKFTDEGRVELQLRAGGDTATLEVRDSGSGIAPEDLDRIFEPFVQVDSSSTRRHQGTGLGLSVSRELARLLGGDITVQSARGGGSTFVLRLPLGSA